MAERREKPQEEHRRAPRVSHPFMIRYRFLAPWAETWMVSPLRDLSGGGARFLSEWPLKVGAILETKLLLSSSRDPVPMQARVAWTKPWRLKIAEVGITFEIGDPKVQEAVDGAVARLLEQRRRR